MIVYFIKNFILGFKLKKIKFKIKPVRKFSPPEKINIGNEILVWAIKNESK